MSDIKKKVYDLTDEQLDQVEWIEFKDPSMMTLIAVLLGMFGVDRFMLDDVKFGVMKLLGTLLTFGIVGLVWWFIDLFNITERTVTYNYKKFSDTISFI